MTTLDGLALRDDSGTHTTGGAGELDPVGAHHSDFSKGKHRTAVSEEQFDSLLWRLWSSYIGVERTVTQTSGPRHCLRQGAGGTSRASPVARGDLGAPPGATARI